jgi:predicted HTH domain antitoxin
MSTTNPKTQATKGINALTIQYPEELLWALQQKPEEFASQAQILLAVKLYETGKLSTGLAAQVAGVSRTAFFYILGQHGLSPFGETPDELENDLANARTASHPQ